MSVTLAHVTFDCADPQRVAGFWSSVLETPVDEGASEFFASIDDHVAEKPSWFFIRTPEAKTVKNRLHIDLTAANLEAEVTRIIGSGATRHSDHNEWGAEWTVLTDPEGNEFCIGQQPADPR